jgi:hypothetical protein
MGVGLNGQRRYTAGDFVEDLCRACKIEREHRVLAADAEGRPLRVVCGFCGSQHNFRGGGARSHAPRRDTPAARAGPPLELVSERERTAAVMSTADADLELMLRRIIREEAGLTPVAPAEKWRGGHLVLRPGREGLQEKTLPIETLFHKVVMVRNRLRTLEQQLNAAELPEDLKLKLQSYVTGCYGSLTTFNVLFADEAEGFKGSGQ